MGAYVDVEDAGAGCFEGLGGGGPRLGMLVMGARWLEGGALAMVGCCELEGVRAEGFKGR